MTEENDITIRLATEADVKAIANILHELSWFEHINKESRSETEARIIRHLRLCNADESHVVLIAEEKGGKVVGYTVVHWSPYFILTGPEGFISELFVQESKRGIGVGRKLLEVVKIEAIDRGCSRLSLLNGRDTQSYEKSFYKKLGWTERVEMANFILPLSDFEDR